MPRDGQWTGDSPPQIPLFSWTSGGGASRGGGGAIASVERCVEISTEGWAGDLRALFEHAKDRFGDVSWESEDGRDRVWGHKAIIYARAPKAFRDRYFISKPFARASTSLRSPSPAGPSVLPATPTEPPSSFRASPLPGRSSALSAHTYRSETTVRAENGATLRLTHGDTPELFRAQLEWLYTGEGFGDVVEWISAEDDSGFGNGGSIRDSLGRRGNIHERRDRLGQDLTYMWRSKLYTDVRIHLDDDDSGDDTSSDEGSVTSADSFSTSAIFPAHRFVLVSRSPYFASVLLNHSAFSEPSHNVHLPSPPFTAASLHYCLGWMYAGHLDFSNRSFDLSTAFQIHRGATYLQLDALVGEIEARITHDFCHGLAPMKGKVHCKTCALRAARVWKFASGSDVSAPKLAAMARSYIVDLWADSWSREVALADESEREELVRAVISRVYPGNVIATFRSVAVVKARMEAALRAKGREAAMWVDILEKMVERVRLATQAILLEDFAKIADGKELWSLLGATALDSDLIEVIGRELLEALNTPKGSIEGPRIYQTLVSAIVLKVDPVTLQTTLPPRGTARQQIETTKSGVLAHIRRRWMQVRDAGGFERLENWALKEIADEIEVPLDDMIASQPPISVALRPPPPNVPSEKPRILHRPRPVPRELDETSVRGSRTSSASRRPPSRSEAPLSSSGLRRLRLSSSASTNSASSNRTTVSIPQKPAQSMTGPQARSPTAARQGSTVSIGAGQRARLNGMTSPSPSTRNSKAGQPPTSLTPRSLSGPPRPLSMRSTLPLKEKERSASPATSSSSARTNKTAQSKGAPGRMASTSTTPVASQTNATRPVLQRAGHGVEVGPSRLRTPSSSTAHSILKTATPPNTASSPSITKPVRAPPKMSETLREPLPTLRAVGTSTTSQDKVTLQVPSNRQQATSAGTVGSVRSRVASINSQSQAAPAKPPPVRPKLPSVTSKSTIAATRKEPKTGAEASSSTVQSVAKRQSASAMPGAGMTTSMTPSGSRNVLAGRQTPKSAPPTPDCGETARASSAASKSSPSTRQTNSTGKTPASPARSRTTSAKSTSSITPKGVTPSSSRPNLRPLKPVAFPSAPPVPPLPFSSRSKSTIRSASSSTDDAPEARTPRTSHLSSLPEPRILRDGSDGSESAYPMSLSRSTSPKVPSLITSRTDRKVSSSSTKSNSSLLRLHPASAFDPPRRVDISLGPLPSEGDLPEGAERFDGSGVELNVGVPCIVSLKAKRARFRASIKYIGHLKGSRGAWVGLEVDNLDRLGVNTLPNGVRNGIHYFHLSKAASTISVENRTSRQRRIEQIRERLRQTSRMGSTAGLVVEHEAKRSVSPLLDFGGGGFENPRALFVRPSEIVFVLGAE